MIPGSSLSDASAYGSDEARRLAPIIDLVELPDQAKQFLRSRWLSQIDFMERQSYVQQRCYYVFRVAALVGGVIVPALVSLNVDGHGGEWVRWLTFGLSLVVAISVTVEEFFRFGERWRHYRRTAEMLKSEGWSFFQKSGPYQSYPSLADAYATFAAQVEAMGRQEVDTYITQIARERAPGAGAERTEGQSGASGTN